MLVTFLYCIDFPGASDNVENSDEVRGWLMCSHPITSIQCDNNYTLKYGSPRPDVIHHFREFSSIENSGFIINAKCELIDLKRKFAIEIEVKTAEGSSKYNIALNLCSSSIQEIAIDNEKIIFYSLSPFKISPAFSL